MSELPDRPPHGNEMTDLWDKKKYRKRNGIYLFTVRIIAYMLLIQNYVLDDKVKSLLMQIKNSNGFILDN